MIAYIKGEVVYRDLDYVIMDNNGIGYKIYMARTDKINVNTETIIYTYQHIREDANILFGFINMEEHDLFVKLISVKGIGPKIAINAIGAGGCKNIIEAIENNDAKFLKSLPGIGAKASSQIVLDLKGKLITSDNIKTDNNSINDQNLIDAIEGLKALGYKQNEVDEVVKKIEIKDASVNEYMKEALAIFAKKKGV